MLICTQLLVAQTGVNPPRWEVQYTKVYTEGKTVGPGTGILLGGGTSIVTDPALMIGAGPSIRLDNTGNNASIGTNPDVWPLSPNTTYILELQYRIVNRGANTDLLFPTFFPTDLSQQQLKIDMPSLYANAAASGTFSSGVLTNNSRSYTLNITAGLGVSINSRQYCDLPARYRPDHGASGVVRTGLASISPAGGLVHGQPGLRCERRQRWRAALLLHSGSNRKQPGARRCDRRI
jgi:hypothetical protein